MFFFNGYFYTFTIVLQAICVFHCIRKGKQTNWIWLIVFLPFVGSIAYIFTEIINSRDLNQVQSGVGSILNPTAPVRKLEENLRFSDTFNNRVALADAYLVTGKSFARFAQCPHIVLPRSRHKSVSSKRTHSP